MYVLLLWTGKTHFDQSCLYVYLYVGICVCMSWQFLKHSSPVLYTIIYDKLVVQVTPMQCYKCYKCYKCKCYKDFLLALMFTHKNDIGLFKCKKKPCSLKEHSLWLELSTSFNVML